MTSTLFNLRCRILSITNYFLKLCNWIFQTTEHGAESLVFFGDVLSNKTAPQDSKVELSCRLTSDQDVRIKWFKRLTPIQLKVLRQEQHPSLAFVTSLPLPDSKDHDDYVQLSSDDDASNIYKTFKNPYTIELEHQPGFNTFHSKLKISSVTSREAGLYACQASNRKTVSYQFVHLTVFDPKNARRETNFDPQQIIPQNNSLQQQQYFMRPTMSSITSSEIPSVTLPKKKKSKNKYKIWVKIIDLLMQIQIF
ncbi:hypothetical protein HELRODRAFT_174204 [Helobdella robusta]|uniref:Ig-like domain-containing protein n=1 Tax=Helobdella robusta TaxID=6412 RepID=T1F7S3_HELRO|nr:hypothetical protein HELRODRAFT_174204 [Helobdella robusta]ESO02786.1 hypothetical protein HELRODRAFT_174204 [Helobdella robusta]